MNTPVEPLAVSAPARESRSAALHPATVRFLAGSVIAGVWSSIALAPGGTLWRRLVALLAGTSLVYLLFMARLYMAVRQREAHRERIEDRLSRCSFATLLLALFLPEYAGRLQPAWQVTIALLLLCFGVWLAWTALATSARRPSAKLSITAMATLLVLLTAVTTGLAIRKFLVFGYVGQDLAYFGQIMYSTAHGHLFRGNLLQDLLYSRAVTTDFAGHNSPAMFLFVPFYRLWPSPVTLLVMRNLLLLTAAIPVFLLARLRSTTLAACLWTLAFFVTPSLLLQQVFDFYPLTLAAVPLMFAVYFFERKRFAPFVACCMAALLVREDLGFALVMFAFAALVWRRPWRWIIAPAVLGTLWLAFSFLWVLPAALHGARFVTDSCFGHLGSSPRTMLSSLFLHPGSSLLLHSNVVYVKTLLSPTLLAVSFVNPIAWIAAPLTLINLAAGGGPCTTTMIAAQYSVVPATALFAGALLMASGNRRRHRNAMLWGTDPAATPLLLLSCSLAALLFTSPQADGLAFAHQPWEAEAYRVLQMIPPDASVAAPRYMLPHLANRDCMYQTHRLEQYHHPVYEFLIIDTDWRHIDAAAGYQAQYARVSANAAASPALELLYDSPQFRVYRNPSAHGVSCYAEPRNVGEAQVKP